MAPIQPFTIAVPDDVLDDLAQRLKRTRWPDAECVDDWSQGIPLAYTRELAEYWADGYDWRARESALNRFDQFTTDIDGLDIHFVHQRCGREDAFPLIITHGWPGSIAEFGKVIAPLCDAGFDVVCPSLPGYGFSGKPTATGWGVERIAQAWDTLMGRLGYQRYVAQGGDWGAIITSWLALDHPKNLAAIHLNMLGLRPPMGKDSPPLSDEEKSWLERAQARRGQITAYQQIQGTKPQTLAYGLTDSPAGLAAWILEKFHGWTIPDEDAPPPFDLDRLLTNIMLYWIGGINAANWIYVSIVEGTAGALKAGEYVKVPTGVFLFPNDLASPAPEAWIRRSYNLAQRNISDRGGHFPAMENGELLTADMRAFFRRYR